MKYSSVVSYRDGMLLKRHWFDKANKCWWALIINGSIDDSVRWPWALSYSMGSEWIMNEEFPDWSVRLSPQTLHWHFNGAPSTKRQHTTTQLSPPSCRTGRIAASQQGEGHGVNQYSPLTMKNVAFKHMNEWDQRLQEGLKEGNLSLSLRSKCLACLSGTQRCTNTHTQTNKRRNKNPTKTGDSTGRLR